MAAKKRKQKRAPKRPSKKTLKSSLLLDESLVALLDAPKAKDRKTGAILRAKREQWIDMMLERAPREGKSRGKAKLLPSAKFAKPEAKQIYSEARAFSSGKALLQWLQNRPFILRANGYEPFTFSKPLPLVSAAELGKVRALPMVKALPKKEREHLVREIIEGFGFGISRDISRQEKIEISSLEFVQELEGEERKQTERLIAEAVEAANRGGVFFSAEIDYERPQKTVEFDLDDTDESGNLKPERDDERAEEDSELDAIWEAAKKRDARGGKTKARKARKKASKK